MSPDIYVFEAISVEPAVSESELQARIEAGEYQVVTWEDDGRIGDGYFVRVGKDGMIGLAMSPELGEDGMVRHRGVAVQANPLDENHRDATIEAELRKIVDDFGTAPDGTVRHFKKAIYVEKDDTEYKVFVEGVAVVRQRVESSQAATADETLFALTLTRYEIDLLRQIIALDIHDYKAGDVPVDAQDPAYGRRRVADCEVLLGKLSSLLG